MNILLIFFALPIATIIISIALQKILKNPPLVAAVIFAIFLIVTFIINNLNFLIATIVYTIISYITAVIVCLICRFLNRSHNREDNCKCRERNCNSCSTLENNGVLTIDGDFENNGCNGVLTISALNNTGNSNHNNCCGCSNDWNSNSCGCNNGRNSNSCGCNNSNSNGVSARINVIPNSNTNGRTGCLCGNYRRR